MEMRQFPKAVKHGGNMHSMSPFYCFALTLRSPH
jgi:hypothetical protein